MRKVLWALVVLTMNIGAVVAQDQCKAPDVLAKIRPGAVWVMQGDSIEKLKWLDSKQKRPSATEIEKAKQSCIENAASREKLKAQARLELKDSAVSAEKKVQNLILLLDLDQ